MKVRARVAYDGTEFYGFQRQGAFRSVQGEIETALCKVDPTVDADRLRLRGAGRTDTGVHATGQVIAFDLDWRHPMDALTRAVNINLPMDVAIRDVEAAADDFSPRFDALTRTYHYTAYISPTRQPLRDRYALHLEHLPDVDAMNAAAERLLGLHDFAAFGSATTDSGDTVRNLIRARWSREADGLVFAIEANAFLYRMVRRIVNALIKVGRGRLTPDDVSEALASADADRISGLAPAAGLCLVDVTYA